MPTRIQIDIVGPRPGDVDIEELSSILDDLRRASPRTAQLFDAINTQITKLEEIDAAEVNAHKVVWDRLAPLLETAG